MNEYRFLEKDHVHQLFDGQEWRCLIGTSTAVGVLHKELTYWASGMALGNFGWINSKLSSKDQCIKSAEEALTKIKTMSVGDYLNLLTDSYHAHRKKKESSAKTGSSNHELMETYINEAISGKSHLTIPDIVKPFDTWASKNVKQFLGSELHTFSKKLWVGGILDFLYIDKDDKLVLGDFKSTKTSPYFNQWLQVGGYDYQCQELGKAFDLDGNPVLTLDKPIDYHAIFSFSVGLDKPFFNHNVEMAKRGFSHCVEIYRDKMLFERR